MTEGNSRLLEKLQEAQAMLKRGRLGDPPTRKELARAKKSPAYQFGDRVLVYKDDEPGTILCADTRYPGYWIVSMDREGSRHGWLSVAWGNIEREGESHG